MGIFFVELGSTFFVYWAEAKARSHLPKLLNFQLLLASQNQAAYPKLQYDVACFVAKLTAGIPKALDINSEASTMLGSCGE